MVTLLVTVFGDWNRLIAKSWPTCERRVQSMYRKKWAVEEKMAHDDARASSAF
jgi:hypothetical protein